MTVVPVALAAIAAFAVAIARSGLGVIARDAVETTTDGIVTMLDREEDDRVKERAVRRAGLQLLVTSWRITWRLLLAVAAAAVPVVLADLAALAPAGRSVGLLVDPVFLLVVTVVAGAVAWFARRPTPESASASVEAGARAYSAGDRLVHAVAFASPRVQRAATRLEDRLLRDPVDEPSGPPVLVTSLARAGTTALLNALHDLPGVATHTYRDMPFVTAPTAWNRLAGGDRRHVERHERAHGDGLHIDLDAPEALEEVVWRMHWPDHYRGRTIPLWTAADRREDAEADLRRHMGRIVHARRTQAPAAELPPSRYVSKNNANVARLGLLPKAFPGATIVVPLRRPECHAASLLRQHRNFLDRHAADDFTRRYMRDLGHFEFGAIHRPYAFPGLDPDRHDPRSVDYWLDLWVHAFREVRRHADAVVLVDQDDLRAAPYATVAALTERAGLPRPDASVAGRFRAEPDRAPTDGLDPTLLAEATELHRELASLAVGGPVGARR